MSNYFIIFFLLLIISAGLISCSRSSNDLVNPDNNSSSSASIFIISSPAGAQIYQGNFFTNKSTPDSINNLTPGYISFTLKLFNYKDTTFTAFLDAGSKKYYNINLTYNTEAAFTWYYNRIEGDRKF